MEKINSMLCHGFVDKSTSISWHSIGNGQPEVMVSTMGRLIDFIEDGTISLLNTTLLIIDGFDLLTNGDMNNSFLKILSQIRPDRQLIFLADYYCKEDKIENDIKLFTKDFITLKEISNYKLNIKIIPTGRYNQITLIHSILSKNNGNTIIFVNSAHTMNYLTRRLLEYAPDKEIHAFFDKTRLTKKKYSHINEKQYKYNYCRLRFINWNRFRTNR